MKTIRKIARTELALLFYSPIAWFLSIVFLWQCGMAYIEVMDSWLIQQGLGGQHLKQLRSLTLQTFAPPSGMLPSIAAKLYLYLPLLTMGLMSREISSGTIKLLYSSPTKVREIIFGKFLAMMLYNLLLVTIVAIICLAGFFNIQSADGGVLLCGLLGIYLLLCTYAAIGLFMSCLTSYQVVAALCTLVLLAGLNYVRTIWQDIDFVRDLTWFLSIAGRAEHIMGGLLSSKDILYFFVIIYFFLGAAIYKLQSDRESKSGLVKAMRYVFIVVSGLGVGYVFSLPVFTVYYDATTGKSKTLSVNTQKILAGMGDEPLEVTSYINLLDNHYWYGAPDQRNMDMERWEAFVRFKPNMKFHYVYFYDSVRNRNFYRADSGVSLRTLAERYSRSFKVSPDKFKTPEEMHRLIDLRPEQNRYVMQLNYKGRKTFLRLFDDIAVFPGETEKAAALKRLTTKLPVIAFATGELERSPDKMGDKHYKVLTNDITFRFSLVNQGFDVETVSLKEQEIPAGIAALVIADPAVPLDTLALVKVRNYIAGGGNLLVAGEPGRQSILNPVLQPLGVRLMEGELVQQSRDYAPELVRPYLTPVSAGFSARLQQDAADSLCVSMPGAAALSHDNNGVFRVSTLLATDGRSSWNKEKKEDGDTVTSIGGQRGAFPTMLGLTRMINGKEQRIIVAGDADFLSNAELGRSNVATCNFDFSMAVMGWFTYGAFPVNTSRPPSKDNRILLSYKGLGIEKILLLGVLPGLLLVFGTVLLLRRKRE
jgi:ABC-2 type transport system permease protein